MKRMYAILAACLLAGSTMTYAEQPMGDNNMPSGCSMHKNGAMNHGDENGDRGMNPGCCAMHGGKGMMGGQCKGGLMMLMCRPGMEKVLEDAGIAKTTISKLAEMGKTARTACESQMIKKEREELNIKEQLLKDSPDMQAIQTSINTKSQIMADLEFSKIKMELDIKALINKDDMVKIMKALKDKRCDMKQDKNDCKSPAPDHKK